MSNLVSSLLQGGGRRRVESATASAVGEDDTNLDRINGDENEEEIVILQSSSPAVLDNHNNDDSNYPYSSSSSAAAVGLGDNGNMEEDNDELDEEADLESGHHHARRNRTYGGVLGRYRRRRINNRERNGGGDGGSRGRRGLFYDAVDDEDDEYVGNGNGNHGVEEEGNNRNSNVSSSLTDRTHENNRQHSQLIEGETIAIETIMNDDETGTGNSSGIAAEGTETSNTNNSPTITITPIVVPSTSATTTTRNQRLLLSAANRRRRRTHLDGRVRVQLLLLSFLLVQAWANAINTGDLGTYLICILGTLYVTGMYRAATASSRSSENNDEDDDDENSITRGLGLGDPSAEFDLHNLSAQEFLGATDEERFEAQLLAAIWESRMAAMMNGFGITAEELNNNNEDNGVREEHSSKWERYLYPKSSSSTAELSLSTPSSSEDRNREGIPPLPSSLLMKEKEGYTHHHDGLIDDELPTCSICLCEYEPGDILVKLPCSHLYHEECIMSWTKNHVRCPLCNHDLNNPDGTAGNNSDSILSSPSTLNVS